MSKKKRVLCLFDFMARTGFGTVSKNIVDNITKHFGDNLELDIVAINYFGEQYWYNKQTLIISGRLSDPKEDPFGRIVFAQKLQQIDYDGVFICQDLGVIVPIIDILQHLKNEKKDANRKQFKSIFYFPVDCAMIYELAKGLEFFDCLVTYTEYGKREVLKVRPDLKGKLKVVPHGNNPKDFYPLQDADRVSFRKEYFGENAGKFIINNTNRNQPRKDIPNTIFGFIEAKEIWDKDLPAPFLYLHCHKKDPQGHDIKAVMMQTSLIEEVDYMLISDELQESMPETEMVNKIYNASDVIISTTLGEGWGLTITEAMAAKVPVICPLSTSFIEITENGNNAFVLDTLYPYCNTIDNVIRQQTDIYQVAERMLEVARLKKDNSPVLKDKVDKAYKYMSKIAWDAVCERWIAYFKEVF